MTDPSLGVLLFIPYRHMEQRILAAVNAAGHPITLAQGRLLQRIDPEGSRLTTLAEAAQMTKQSAGYLVDELERAGYAERTPDPADGRAKLVRIAARGHEAIEVARPVQAQIEEEWAVALGPDQTDALRRALLTLRTLTDPYA